MFSAEGTGRNIEQAIENALFELKASRDDVDIKIISEGSIFKKAKVVVTISEDARSKYEKVKTLVEEEKQEEKVEKPKEEIKKEEIKEVKKEIEKETDEETMLEEVDEEVSNKQLKKVVDPVDFLKGLFEKAGKTVEIKIKDDEKYITYSVEGEDLGDMIGHRGECYYAISKLLSAVSGRQEKKILLDIGGFKEKRAESLTALAHRMASKVVKTGRYVKLDPMNPSDRRIIHTALQDDERVTTLSKGEEPHRYVMIFLKESD